MKQRLTRKKAIELSIELWEWLAETGGGKNDWVGWEWEGGEYKEVEADCFLCEYSRRRTREGQERCEFCPLFEKSESSCFDTAYEDWEDADDNDDTEARKEYAKLFLEQLKELRDAGV